MKYVWIAIVVVLLTRIDYVMKIFQKTADKIQPSSKVEVSSNEITNNDQLISVQNDVALKTSPRQTFLNVLKDFSVSPDKSLHDKAFEVFKNHPTIFTEFLDKELESDIYQWRNLVLQKNKATYDFLLELQNILRGENLEMVKRFFSLVIDNDMTNFLLMYSKTKDSNCLIITYIADRLSEEESYNELNERMIALNSLISVEKVEPVLKTYGLRCQMVLKIQLDKLKASFNMSPTPELIPVSPPADETQTSPLVSP